ncbi:CD225/dispanin family protein [Rhodococcus sp. USK10]|uniref:CD225/dispanin family protein n=1 Tax=Rhodococcus TaxID=1827 RepID=UPI001C470D60|nr:MULTISPECIES: CD225/dispanin family protein [Rhodococcus]MBV6761950.1 CD225/dispanin family protein [Rhodococcus opacus]QYB04510.1 CD225/dispanin family protein [Rhodococcus sp. USK10]
MSSSATDPIPSDPTPPTTAARTSDESARPRPSANAGWAVASALFFWPLAFSAFTHAFNVYPLWASGDVDGAQDASDRVRRLGQLSLWIFGGLLILFAILYTLVAVAVITHGGGHHGMMHYRYG